MGALIVNLIILRLKKWMDFLIYHIQFSYCIFVLIYHSARRLGVKSCTNKYDQKRRKTKIMN